MMLAAGIGFWGRRWELQRVGWAPIFVYPCGHHGTRYSSRPCEQDA